MYETINFITFLNTHISRNLSLLCVFFRSLWILVFLARIAEAIQNKASLTPPILLMCQPILIVEWLHTKNVKSPESYYLRPQILTFVLAWWTIHLYFIATMFLLGQSLHCLVTARGNINTTRRSILSNERHEYQPIFV